MKGKRKIEKDQTEFDYGAVVDLHDVDSSVHDSADANSEPSDMEHDSNEDDESTGASDLSADEDDVSLGRRTIEHKVELPPAASGEQCTFDLRNLLALNSHQVDVNALYKRKEGKQGFRKEDTTISHEKLSVRVNESVLLDKANDGCTQLLHALWQLPMEKSDAGPMVALPSYFETKLPRALPPPPPKQETKWEKFAKERGMVLNKEKRSRKVWDETQGTWMFRHGYQKSNNDAVEWPIMEVKRNDNPYEDPWERIRDAKRKRVDKNVESRLRNEERTGQVTRGTATRVMKNLQKTRSIGKTGGNLDRYNVTPSGVPVDLQSTGGFTKRGKPSTVAALRATQISTASLGRFDQMREGEPERKKAQANLKKHKFESATDRKVTTTEAERGLKVLKSVMSGGGAAREKAKRKGAFAKGETAYDYEYDDGLGASSFRKKKGRAGAGKLKKLTKKRVT